MAERKAEASEPKRPDVHRMEMVEGTPSGEAVIGGAPLGLLVDIAHKSPRPSIRELVAELTEELELTPAAASSNYYSIPYKTHEFNCPDKKKPSKQQKCQCPTEWVQGVGIGGAVSIRRIFRNCATATAIASQTNTDYFLVGRAVDFERNVLVEVPYRVSKIGHKYDGGTYKKSDRVLSQELAAALSKVERNVTLKMVPRPLVEAFFRQARCIAARLDETREEGSAEDKLVLQFSRYGIPREALERLVGKPIRSHSLTDDEVANLRALDTAIRSGEVLAGDVVPLGIREEEEKADSAVKKDRKERVDKVLKRGATVTRRAPRGNESDRNAPQGYDGPKEPDREEPPPPQ